METLMMNVYILQLHIVKVLITGCGDQFVMNILHYAICCMQHVHVMPMNFATLFNVVAQPCNETNAIRLTYGNIPTIGRLEVCSGGHWGTVCSHGTTSATATVACRQLNHAAIGKNFATPY